MAVKMENLNTKTALSSRQSNKILNLTILQSSISIVPYYSLAGWYLAFLWETALL